MIPKRSPEDPTVLLHRMSAYIIKNATFVAYNDKRSFEFRFVLISPSNKVLRLQRFPIVHVPIHAKAAVVVRALKEIRRDIRFPTLLTVNIYSNDGGRFLQT